MPYINSFPIHLLAFRSKVDGVSEIAKVSNASGSNGGGDSHPKTNTGIKSSFARLYMNSFPIHFLAFRSKVDGVSKITKVSNASGSGGGGDIHPKTHMGIKSSLAGGIAGATQISITYPLEFLKTEMQLGSKDIKHKCDAAIACIKKTYRERGLIGFYRGLGVTLCGCIPKAGVRFYVIELIKKAFEEHTGQFNGNMKLIAGIAGGSVEAVVAVCPSESLKVKFINDERSANPQFRGIVHGAKTIFKQDGIRGIYQGLTATILKEGTNQGIRFSVVETLKDIYNGGERNKSVPVLWTGLFGAIGGAASVVSNNPLDVVKTRMQGLEAHRYKNTWDCFKQIYQHEGWKTFMKGSIPRMYRVSGDVAITFIVYDKVMEWFHQLF